ncbi:UNVERIFIED_CONTAM: hypothetical protein NY603_30035, partial [Bacteroidetes bacterium 56_B9]
DEVAWGEDVFVCTKDKVAASHRVESYLTQAAGRLPHHAHGVLAEYRNNTSLCLNKIKHLMISTNRYAP